MELLAFGLITLFNFWVIFMKLQRFRVIDAIVDVTIMCIILKLFAGSYAGMIVGMIASAGMSCFLWWYFKDITLKSIGKGVLKCISPSRS